MVLLLSYFDDETLYAKPSKNLFCWRLITGHYSLPKLAGHLPKEVIAGVGASC